jgi:hypothetical protein
MKLKNLRKWHLINSQHICILIMKTQLTGLITQTSLKHSQYPKTITKASNVLSDHRFDNAGKIHNGKHKENDSNG